VIRGISSHANEIEYCDVFSLPLEDHLSSITATKAFNSLPANISPLRSPTEHRLLPIFAYLVLGALFTIPSLGAEYLFYRRSTPLPPIRLIPRWLAPLLPSGAGFFPAPIAMLSSDSRKGTIVLVLSLNQWPSVYDPFRC